MFCGSLAQMNSGPPPPPQSNFTEQKGMACAACTPRARWNTTAVNTASIPGQQQRRPAHRDSGEQEKPAKHLDPRHANCDAIQSQGILHQYLIFAHHFEEQFQDEAPCASPL